MRPYFLIPTIFFSFVGKRRKGLVKGRRKYFKKSLLYHNQTVVIKIESYSQYTSLWFINVNQIRFQNRQYFNAHTQKPLKFQILINDMHSDFKINFK